MLLCDPSQGYTIWFSRYNEMPAKTRSKSKQKLEAQGAEPTTTGITGPVFVEGFMHFSDLDLHKLELAQARLLTAQQAIGLKHAEIERLRHEYEDKIRKIKEEVVQIANTQREAEVFLRSVHHDLEVVYKIPLKEITYNDQNGRILLQGEPVPQIR